VPFEIRSEECSNTERRDEDGTDQVDPPQDGWCGRTDALEKQVPTSVRNRSSRDEQENEWTNC
jgi:hypothetical protein